MIINRSKCAFQVLQKKFNSLQEEVWLLCLDSNLRLLQTDLIFRGTVNECTFHPRDLIRILCERNASGFVVAHNHPSGRVFPSRQDRLHTRRLQKLTQLLGIPMQDHIIFSDKEYFSFADTGQLKVSVDRGPRE